MSEKLTAEKRAPLSKQNELRAIWVVRLRPRGLLLNLNQVNYAALNNPRRLKPTTRSGTNIGKHC